ARTVRDFQLGEIEARIDTSHPNAPGAIVCWNPLPTDRRGPLSATVTLPADASDRFRLVDASGQDVPFQSRLLTNRSETSYLSFNKPLKDFEVTIDADQAGWGYRTFHLLPAAAKTRDNDIEWCRKATAQGI